MVNKAMAANPEERYENIGILTSDFETFLPVRRFRFTKNPLMERDYPWDAKASSNSDHHRRRRGSGFD